LPLVCVTQIRPILNHALYPSRHLPAEKVRAFIDLVIELLGTGAT
jgi:hypothetical protein